MRKWILLLLLCGALGALLVYHHETATLEPFRASFLTVTFAVATFSVMFSMGAFNSSAYRQFHQGFPPRLLWACVGLLFVALLPLTVLVLWPTQFVPACLVLLPMLAAAGAALLEIGRRETDPLTLLDRLCSVKAMERHLHSLVPMIDAKIAETKALELSKVEDRPTHEFNWHLPVPTQRNDPLTYLATLGLLSIQHGDLHAFARVVNRSLEVLEFAEAFRPEKTTAGDYQVRTELRSHVFDALQRMILALQRDKGTVTLARSAIDTLAEFVVAMTKSQKQTQDLTFSALYLMETLSRHCYENGSQAEVRVPLIVARQIVQKGMDDPPKVEEGKEPSIEVAMFHHQLPQLTNAIKRLGSYAIEKADSEFLYRCFDAFGWLGCSAVKQEDMGVATACLRALSQLGREVRAKDLECFWDRCPVRPEDHAAERIDYMATWVSQLPAGRQQHWTELLECAYSRLSGRETTVKFGKGPDGKIAIAKQVSEKKHVESYVMQAGARDVDYSDFTFLKDLELHGGKGILMQGPSVPLFPSNSQQE